MKVEFIRMLKVILALIPTIMFSINHMLDIISNIIRKINRLKKHPCFIINQFISNLLEVFQQNFTNSLEKHYDFQTYASLLTFSTGFSTLFSDASISITLWDKHSTLLVRPNVSTRTTSLTRLAAELGPKRFGTESS